MKGSASMESLKKKDGGLGAINEEEEEKESIKSMSSQKQRVKKDHLQAANKSDVSEGGLKPSASAKALSNYNQGGGGGQISAEYQAELDSKFEDLNRTIEDIKDE